MMAGFVNVDDFKKEIMECNADPINEFDLGWDTWGIFNAIDRIPTADVAPVIHAHWIINPKYSIVCNCSNCGVAVRGGLGENYCFNCGAKMDEE